ncbi:MAG: RDD family protein [Elusimicrobia bacterium]|nr:RDD family protein [Elusimicrobiota bacterium]
MNNRIILAALALTGALVHPAAAANRRSKEELVSIGRSVSVAEGETAQSVVVILGSATVRGPVKEGVVTILGGADIDAPVKDDVVSVLGGVHLGPKADIRGSVVTIGGALTEDEGAKISGDRTSIAFPPALRGLPGLGRDWSLRMLWLSPLPPSSALAWGLAGAFLCLYLFAALLMPGPLMRCVRVLNERPASAFFCGALGLPLLGPLSFLLTVSVIGLTAVPFLFCAALAAALFGKAAVYSFAGGQLGREFSLPQLEKPWAAVVAGAAAVSLLHMIPIVGYVVWMMTLALGFGAVILTLFEHFRAEVGADGAAAPVPSPAPTAQAPLPPPTAVATAELSLPRAGFWPRLGAIVLDVVLLAIVGGVTHLHFVGMAGWALYQVGMWTWKGTTFGGIVVGLKGVRLDGRPMDFWVALVRHLASYLSLGAAFIGFLWAAWDQEQQTWHDKIAGTVVVRVPKTQPLI